MAMPRSGSSMTAGIFAAHGVWHGTCRPPDRWNETGYWENTAIDDAMKRRWPRKVIDRVSIEAQEDFFPELEAILKKQGYRSGPWLMKMSAAYWPAWAPLEPFWVCVRRDPQNILQSCLRSRMIGNDSERVQSIIEHHLRQLDMIVELGAAEVLVEDVVHGDLSSLEDAFEHCRLEFDEARARAFIDKSLWHYG